MLSPRRFWKSLETLESPCQNLRWELLPKRCWYVFTVTQSCPAKNIINAKTGILFLDAKASTLVQTHKDILVLSHALNSVHGGLGTSCNIIEKSPFQQLSQMFAVQPPEKLTLSYPFSHLGSIAKSHFPNEEAETQRSQIICHSYAARNGSVRVQAQVSRIVIGCLCSAQQYSILLDLGLSVASLESCKVTCCTAVLHGGVSLESASPYYVREAEKPLQSQQALLSCLSHLLICICKVLSSSRYLLLSQLSVCQLQISQIQEEGFS